MAIDNDTRGWIMTGISGVACVVGASVICVDIVVRLFPGMRNFSISESDAFLSASLSLSFGVMLYSALYSMLPQSKTYLEDAGYSPRAASYMQIGLFLGGVVGIRILSGVLHKFIPSHVVDCDHTHDEEAKTHSEGTAKDQRKHDRCSGSVVVDTPESDNDGPNEDTPLLSRTSSATLPHPQRAVTAPDGFISRAFQADDFETTPSSRRPSFFPRNLSRTFTKYISSRKTHCDESGPCMGYSDPCGQDCFKIVQKRHPSGHPVAQNKHLAWQKTSSAVHGRSQDAGSDLASETISRSHSPCEQDESQLHSNTHRGRLDSHSRSFTHHYHHPEGDRHARFASSRRSSVHSHQHSIETDHHHHVPTNAFMSIGLQTSLAIALHKLPEGFITYATNHANPSLGFSVFMALFIHNITEGFALSLPLYLALNSRLKAIIWSSFLGGFSQPLGAGVAALWFRIAANGRMAPNQGVYGGMFAITSGVMTSVALSLYSESLQLSHNKGTCIAFAFLGMAILGLSYALTAK